ncbi:MAG: glutathione S-transferase family protein [Pseudomonadota bacterium]
MLTLWHCEGARSFRPLWALEEMGLAYELKLVPFPPRFRVENWKEINPFGTIPAFTDGDAPVMTESVAICEYLGQRHGPTDLVVAPDEADYGLYLNTMYQADATMTFPQTIALRYRLQEPEKQLGAAADDYVQWFFARLKAVAGVLGERPYMAADRFTMADISLGFALQLASRLKLGDFPDNIEAYWQRLQERPAYQRAMAKEKG